MAQIHVSGALPYGRRNFPFGEISEPEEFELVSKSSTKFVAQNIESTAFDGYVLTFEGTELSNTVPGPEGFIYPWPTTGTLSKITLSTPTFEVTYVGELDAATLVYRAWLYENNYDDELISFSSFVYGSDDQFHVTGGRWVDAGWQGDDTYYFYGAPDPLGYGVYGGNSLRGDVPDTEIAAGNDTVNFQGVTGGVIFTGSDGVENVVGSNRNDTLYISPFGFDELSETYVFASGYSVLGELGNDLIYGSIAGDFLNGGRGNDIIYGERPDNEFASARVLGSRDDTIYAGSGNDIVYSAAGDDFIHGGPGDDQIFVGGGSDTITGGSGRDTLNLSRGNPESSWNIHLARGEMIETRGNSTYVSSVHSIEDVVGSSNGDRIAGSAGDNRIQGGLGNDVLIGREGADVFAYAAVADSPVIGRDRILDFHQSEGDKIDFSELSANLDLPLTFIGSNPFSGTAGELHVSYRSSGDAVVTIDIDGDETADLNILLRKITADQPLTQDDFIF